MKQTLTLHLRAAAGLFALIPLTAHAAQTDASSSLWAMIQQGGWAMYPLAACSLGLILLIVHCVRETRPRKFGDDGLVDRVSSLVLRQDISGALQAAQNDASALGRAVANGLRKAEARQSGASIESVEAEMLDTLEVEENGIAQWIHYLSVTANVAPMIGLLGTVSGMIGGFQTMASGGMGRPELFAGDIGEALITTATGLCIGIPAMVAHSYFSNRLNTLMVETTRRANTVADGLRQEITALP